MTKVKVFFEAEAFLLIVLMQLNFTVPGGQGDPIPETDEASIVLVSFVLKAMYMMQIMKDQFDE